MDLQRADAGRLIDDAGEGFGSMARPRPASARGRGSAGRSRGRWGRIRPGGRHRRPADRRRSACRRSPRGSRRCNRRRRTWRGGIGGEATGFKRRDLCVLLRQAQRGLRWREAREADFVAGAKLAHLPQLGLRDGGGADEAAERRAVGAEDHRHVAGEIDGADGVRIVVDVARMEPGFATVFARPDGLRADEADAGRGSNCSEPPTQRRRTCRCSQARRNPARRAGHRARRCPRNG